MEAKMNQTDLEALATILSKKNETVTAAANNPMTWLTIAGTILFFCGTILYQLYSKNNDAINKEIRINRQTIEKVQNSLSDSQAMVLQMQTNQQIISAQIKENAIKMDSMAANINQINMTRFEEKDGRAIKDDLMDRFKADNNEIVREMTEIKNELRSVEKEVQDLNYLKQVVQQNASELKTRTNFMEDMSKRMREVEINNK